MTETTLTETTKTNPTQTDPIQTDPTAAHLDSALKAKHRAMWALGDYPTTASTVIPTLGRAVVEAARLTSGDRVLDVAAGSGNASLPAARTGAEIVATDLTPELLDEGRHRAEEEGLDLVWQVADAEALPFEDGSFDAAISSVGVMFAPHHEVAARELLRVVRPGGRIALASWTPAGFVGQMLAAMKPYAPAPPPGSQPPPLWGDPAHVADLFGDDVVDVTARPVPLTIDCFETAEDFREFFKAHYGPTIAVYRAIADDPERTAALDAALLDLARSHDTGGGVMEWEYLLWTGTHAG